MHSAAQFMIFFEQMPAFFLEMSDLHVHFCLKLIYFVKLDSSRDRQMRMMTDRVMRPEPHLPQSHFACILTRSSVASIFAAAQLHATLVHSNLMFVCHSHPSSLVYLPNCTWRHLWRLLNRHLCTNRCGHCPPRSITTCCILIFFEEEFRIWLPFFSFRPNAAECSSANEAPVHRARMSQVHLHSFCLYQGLGLDSRRFGSF